MKNAADKSIIEVKANKLEGPANSITQKTSTKGGIERNYYDGNGKQYKQISNNNHGKPKQHPYGEHAHDYKYDKDGRFTRPMRN